MSKNITSHNFGVSRADREISNNHKSFLIWFTGLSGSGKSTIANALEIELNKKDVKTYILDGDNVRTGLNKDLSFSPKDRTENIRRIAEVSNLMVDAGLVVISAFVSPYKKDREAIRSVVKDVNFVEIFVNTSLEECERRDVKGLYKKARSGEIKNMTGISAPYETPEQPDVEIRTEAESVEEAVEKIMKTIAEKLKLKDV
ncbi:adenylyl-sulfate kinase [Winogradskyella ursingii]|uniref:adenylyl-sulfate kinase n=1 Tax=Winogradskyella ursingii TaxID=2686079 RepID=UPI0015CAF657|nr:adenylyl-sulfate kinase [Winogradskyella ursingii]